MCFGQSDEVDLMCSDEGEDCLPFGGGKSINVEEEGVEGKGGGDRGRGRGFPMAKASRFGGACGIERGSLA